MKVLVTGGAGYIGSVTVERLIGDGETVIVFDNLSQGHLAAVHPDAVFIEGDLADRGAIESQSRIYNLGNGLGFSVKQVIETARDVTGHEIPAKVVARRPGDVATLVAGSDKIRHELGWQPEFPDIRQIIESAWLWHQANPSGYAESVV